MKIKLTINDMEIEVEKGTTILQAARQLGIDIPNLCNDNRLEAHGACRICVVHVEGARSLMASCTVPATDGMVIRTETEDVVESRKQNLNLLLANHPLDCLTCNKAGNCKLQDYCYRYDVKETSFQGARNVYEIDDSNEFYTMDANKCILCGKCVRVCNELQCTAAIGKSERGFISKVSTPFEQGLSESACVSCGNCVAACPVGALQPKNAKFRSWEIEKVQTTCSYCGVGCQMELLVKDGKVVGVEPADGEPNEGLLCVKGRFAYNFINHPDRLKTPLIKKNGKFEEATWDEAMELIVSKFKAAKENFGSDSVAGLSSARCTNEENYLMQKFIRAVMGTNNVDHCARLCHGTTVSGLATTLGSGAMTNTIAGIEHSDVIFIIGSNTTEAHPVIGTLVKRAKAKGAKLIVGDPREIELAKNADVFMQLKPGTNVALFNGLMNVIINENLQDKAFIEERCENYDELLAVVKEYTPERVEEITTVKADLIREAARMYATGQKVSILYSMGITQFSTGTNNVFSVSNLAMLCGHLGKDSCGVNPLRGQNNVQGACDMGALPVSFPGYQAVHVKENVEKFEKAWGAKLSDKPGLTVTEIVHGLHDHSIKALYIMGENPMVSDPDANHVQEALEHAEFLVVQDIFLTETAQFADVVLPAASFAEKDGTFTSTERRVQRVRKAIEPKGQARADWEILSELIDRFGMEANYTSAEDVFNEVASVTPSYAGMDYDRLEGKGLQWPCPTKDHPGTPVLHIGKFTRGKGLFKGVEYQEAAEMPDAEYPITLTTGRVLYQYHTMTMTGKSEGIMNIAGESFVEINPSDAKKYGITDGGMVKVSSRRGAITVKAKVSDIVNPEVVFIPFHYAEGSANRLTNSAVDKFAKQPELKVCAVKIEAL